MCDFVVTSQIPVVEFNDGSCEKKKITNAQSRAWTYSRKMYSPTLSFFFLDMIAFGHNRG